jgi:hypothetical protein
LGLTVLKSFFRVDSRFIHCLGGRSSLGRILGLIRILIRETQGIQCNLTSSPHTRAANKSIPLIKL